MFQYSKDDVEWGSHFGDGQGLVLEQLQELFEDAILPFEKRNLVNLDERGRFSINDVSLPFSALPYVFQNAYSCRSTSTENREELKQYDITINDEKFSYVKHGDGTREFLKNDRRHCAHGPAVSNANTGEWQYFLNGKLHCTSGPAVVSANGRKQYALFGRVLSLEEFVENNPFSTITACMRGQHMYIITYWDDYAVVDGLDGTKVLLKKSSLGSGPNEFLTELIARPLRDYRVIRFINVGSVLKPIHDYTKSIGDWQYTNSPDAAALTSPEQKVSLAFDKETRRLIFESKNKEDPIRYKINLSFETSPKVGSLTNLIEYEDNSSGAEMLQINLIRDFQEGDHNQTKGDSSMANTTENPGRFGQVTDGMKTGLKRGTIKVTSGKAAEAIAQHLPLNDSIPMEKLTQLVLLIASAEVVERAPDNVANRVGLTPERRTSYGEMSRTLGGEILGRDAVQLFSKLAPMLLENLQGLSAEDIAEVADHFEVQENIGVPVEAAM